MTTTAQDILHPAEKAEPVRRGRPRRLQIEQILEAALAVGLQHLTMSSVAERLGVGKAVLYGYVGSREELIRLAAAHAARRHRFPVDEGQPWDEWIIAYSKALFEVLTMDGELLETWLSGSQSLALEIDTAEMWLSVLTRRGFSGEAALHLRRAVSHLVIGAAAARRREMALRAQGNPRPLQARAAVRDRSAQEMPFLQQFAEIYGSEMTEASWLAEVRLLLRGAAADRDLAPHDPAPSARG